MRNRIGSTPIKSTIFNNMKAILVLNADYIPLSVAPFNKGFKLTYKGKAEVVETKIDDLIETANLTFERPSVIRLLRHVVLPYKKITLTRHNVFKRDDNTCLYCPSRKDLTLDHVIPRSKGGKDSWENLASCCQECNVKKADKTPEEAGMKLRYTPFVPNHFMMLLRSNQVSEEWKPYIFA